MHQHFDLLIRNASIVDGTGAPRYPGDIGIRGDRIASIGDLAAALALGDTLLLVPGHCDPTVNLYDELVCCRGNRVEAIWPIAARGALL